jgi:thymidylate kinase
VAQFQVTQPDLAVPVHPSLAAAFQALDDSGSWLLLRGENDLVSPSGDVDILVSTEQLRGLDSVLKAVGFSRIMAPGHGSHRFYFSYSQVEDLWFKLDIVSDIAFGTYQQWKTSLAARCLDCRVRRGLLWLPAAADQAWLQLLHLFLDKGEIQPTRTQPARHAADVASAEDDLAARIEHYTGTGTAVEILNLVQSGEFDRVPVTAARIRASWTSRAVLGTTIRAGINRALRTISPTVKGTSRRGLAVGVMGPDGAGKTSLLRSLSATLPVSGNYVYMGMWSAGPRDALLSRIPGGRLGKKAVRIFRGSLLARYQRLRGRLVLLDRVPYDTRLPGSVDKSVGGRISAALAFALAPSPDILLLLDAPGEIMFARKGEHSVEVLESWRRAYLELAQGLPGAWVLDAGQPLKAVRREATALVWSALVNGGNSPGTQQRKRGRHRNG